MENMNIIWEKVEFGHSFKVVELDSADSKGRKFRLYENGHPSIGGQWHYTLDNAQERAEYLLRCSYVRRIEYLEQRVQNLEAQLWRISR